jgi:hypothetical protein
MSNDSPPILTRRKPSITRYLITAFLIIAGLFVAQLLSPAPAIRISPQTTHIVAPLGPDGLPDYVTYLRDKLRAGVITENNAAVPMWEAFGPGDGGDAVSPENWQHIVNELKLSPAKHAYLVEPDSDRVTRSIERWLVTTDPRWRVAVENVPAIAQDPEEIGYELVLLAMDAPWRREQLPPLAAWVDANNDALNLLATGSRLPRFYSPFALPEGDAKPSLLQLLQFDSIMRARTIARALALRAMLHVGEGRHDAAWQDLLAIHRWARHVGKGPLLIEQLVAVAIDRIACDGTAALLAQKLPPQLARQIHNDLLSLGPASDMARSFDEGERLFFVDAVLNGYKIGMGTFIADNSLQPVGESIKPLDYVAVDWNVTLIKGNQIYDQLAAAYRLPTYAARINATGILDSELHQMEQQTRGFHNFAFAAISPTKRSEMLAASIFSLLGPAFGASSEAQDRANATLELTQLAAALAVYRAEHDEYPHRLDQLVPTVILQLPVDLFHAKPFIYQRVADGYLLCSCGPNGNDDGGSGQFSNKLAGRPVDSLPPDQQEAAQKKIPGSADDISIRIPTPPFKLPEPPDSP